jgi:peroxiredoxin
MKRIIVLALCSLPGLLLAQNKPFSVKGTIPRDSKISKIFFSGEKLDSVNVINGAFEYKGTIGEPAPTVIVRDRLGKGFVAAISSESAVMFFLEPGNTFIKLPDTGEFASIKGGKTTREFNTYQALDQDIYQRGVAVFSQLKAAKTPEEAKPLNLKRSEILKEEIKMAYQFAFDYPDSYVSLNRLHLYAQMDLSAEGLSEQEKINNNFSKKIKNSSTGKLLGEYLAARRGTMIGSQARDFAHPDSLGNQISLTAFRGKYVLIDFWASWCGPCREENPNVSKAYASYKDKNFTVLGISLDRKTAKDKWLKAIRDDGLKYPQLWDAEGITAKKYLIKAIPQNYLIDPQGKIIAKNLRGEALQKTLAELLAAKSK